MVDVDQKCKPHSTFLRVLLAACAAFFGLWALLWVLVFPWMLLGDADNGRFSHDLCFVWIPEVGLAAGGGLISLATLGAARRRTRSWALLAAPAAMLLAIAVLTGLVRHGSR